MSTSNNLKLLTAVIGGLLASVKELAERHPVGTEVDIVNKKEQSILVSGTITKWDWSNWLCVLNTGRTIRFNDFGYRIEMRLKQ